MKSIQARLLLWLLIVFSTLWSAITFITYLQSAHEVEEVFDAQLAQAAAVLNQISSVGELLNGDPAAQLEQEVYGHPYEKKMAFQIWRNEQLLLRSANAPTVPMALKEAYSDQSISNAHWRVFSMADPDNNRRIMVGELYEVRDELVNEITFKSLYPLTVSLPLLMFGIWLGIRRSLRPVRTLASQVARRSPSNLDPLRPEVNVPTEIQPLTEALNHLFEKLRIAFEHERQFTADAAHELRTPLASIKTQAQVAQRATSDTDRKHAMQQIIEGVNRATHMIQQLIATARLDPELTEHDFTRVNLTELARRLIAEMDNEAHQKSIELKLIAEQDQVLSGNQAALEFMLRNLLSNALRYTPAAGQVTVEISAAAGHIALSVTDTGPGIPPAERERVFERFYRGEEMQHIVGSGLGLSIVKRVVQLHNATIHLEQPASGIGLRVVVKFPE